MATCTVKTRIRKLDGADVASIVKIERDVYKSPWTSEDFLRCLRQKGCHGFVAERFNELVGYTIYECHSKRLNILNLAVIRDLWRTGIGKELVDRLKLKLYGGMRIRADVSEFNLNAQLFLQAQGFIATGIQPAGTVFEQDDAYVMEYWER